MPPALAAFLTAAIVSLAAATGFPAAAASAARAASAPAATAPPIPFLACACAFACCPSVIGMCRLPNLAIDVSFSS